MFTYALLAGNGRVVDRLIIDIAWLPVPCGRRITNHIIFLDRALLI